MPSPPPELAAFAAELAAELAGQGGPHDDLLVAEAVAAAVRLKLLHADPRIFLPHTVDRSWDRDHDLASRAYFRAHKALLASRSSSGNRPQARRPASPALGPWTTSTAPPGPTPPSSSPASDPRSTASADPATRPTASLPPESAIPNPPSPPIPPPQAAAATTPPSEPFDTFLRPAPRHPRRPIRTHPRDPNRSSPHPTPADRISFRRRPDDILPLTATPRASPAAG